MKYLVSHLYGWLVLALLYLGQGHASAKEGSLSIIKDSSGRIISPWKVFLPHGLVMRPSKLPLVDAAGKILHTQGQFDKDFHIAMHGSNLVLVWAPLNSTAKDYLYGAIYPVGQTWLPSFDDTPRIAELQSIMNSKHKMVATWISLQHVGYTDIASSNPQSEVYWETVQNTKTDEEKWSVAGVHKKRGVITDYLIKKDTVSIWATKEEALKLALEGKLHILISSL